MGKRFGNICMMLILMISLSVYADEYDAGEVELTNMASQLGEMINSARANPLEAAISVGLNPEEVASDFPDLNEILTEGLPPLIFEDRLSKAAAAHTNDMLDHNTYSHLSSDGKGYARRILEYGYLASKTGESLGLIGFSNFISPDEAVRLIFERMFKDELNPDKNKELNILSPDFDEMGIAFGSGKMVLGGVNSNVYIVTCDFARDGAGDFGDRLVGFINEARRAPLETAMSLGVDIERLESENPKTYGLLNQIYPDVIYSGDLSIVADAHVWDMINHRFVGSVSSDGKNLDFRLAEQGVIPIERDEYIGTFGIDHYETPDDAIYAAFVNLFLGELDDAYAGNRIVLNSNIEEAGIGLGIGQVVPDNPSSYVIVADVVRNGTLWLETAMFRLINKARKNPVSAFINAGIDEETMETLLGAQSGLLSSELLPLAENETLKLSASHHKMDMISRLYFSKYSPENTTPYDRVAEAGYEAKVVKEGLALVFTETLEDPVDMAQKMFTDMLAREMEAFSENGINILNTEITEVGIDAGVTLVEREPGSLSIAYIVVVDFGQPVVSKEYLFGNIYRDQNENGVFDFAEGVPALKVKVKVMDDIDTQELIVYTDSLGGYQIPLSLGILELLEMVITDNEDNVVQSERLLFFGQHRNQMKDIKL